MKIGIDEVKSICRALAHNDASPIHFVALCSILEKKATMGEVAEECGFTTAACTGSIDRLELLKYVLRSRDKDDRRKVYVNITQKGRDYLDKIIKAIQSA